jgi:excinuclease ABC subunit A
MERTALRDARTHNLKGIDLDLRPGELVVIAGVSGAGKSSLALDTLYAEGQRRFVESFSAYARQFLERRDRPPVGSLDPVPAAIAVDRGAPVRTSRSTVGTMTELQDYLRLLWTRASTITCDACGAEVKRGTVAGAADAVLARVNGREGVRAVVTYPVSTGDAERYLGVREALLEGGYRRVWIDGKTLDLDEVPPSLAVGRATLDVVVDRFAVRDSDRSRLAEAISTAFARGGRADVHDPDAAGAPQRFVRGLDCANCGKNFPVPSPGLFSFQSPLGACPTCRGFGRTIELDWDKVIPDPNLSIADGVIRAWTGKRAAWERRQLVKLAKTMNVPVDASWKDLPEEFRRVVEHGRKGFDGVRQWFEWLETKTYKMHVRVFLARYRKYETCRACGGSRLRADVHRYRVAGVSLIEAGRLPVSDLAARLAQLPAIDEATDRVKHEIGTRLGYLERVGLGYLSLDRPSRSLSGGEVQRVSLTAALGTSLTGTLMVLDEPTVGLHPRDAARLVEVARGLAKLGNVPVVVEHDLSVIASADRVVELGPGAGAAGGKIVFDGAPASLRNAETPTGRAMRGHRNVSKTRRMPTGWLVLRGARGHNLKNVTARFPLGVFTCVTGVSGSGKSSLVAETLYPAVARSLGLSVTEAPLPFDVLEGAGIVRGIEFVDQAPLGRTSRGNAATYMKAYDCIRSQFAALPDSKARGYLPGTFSFNVDGGRCPSCNGDGFETVEMQFLADVSFKCPDCHGRRFRDEVLEVRCRGWSIADVLERSAREVVDHFSDVPALVKALEPMLAVGLGYLALGQPLSMLSGGEAQRLKLARALVDANAGSMLVLDEPTAGLHRHDVETVLGAIDALVARGVSVIAVEHDPFVAAHADHVIDVGPEAADAGGEIVAEGTPEAVSSVTRSRFAPFLGEALRGDEPAAAAPRGDARDDGSSARNAIVVEGAHEHNLRVPHVEVPREKLVVVTGPSGSGKSSLAFDVVYAEGQRRFLETLSPYARQYLPSLGRADVDQITGIPPAISLEQRTARAGAMSTVATVTEVAHYLRLLFAKAGTPYCPKCNVAIGARTPLAIAQELANVFPAKANLSVWAPVVRGRKGLHKEVIERAVRAGIETVRIDGETFDPRKAPALKKTKEHDIAFWLGAAKASDTETLVALVQRAASLAEAHAVIERDERDGTTSEPLSVSTRRACPRCARGVPELDPRHFSFNTRQGQCADCEGTGLDESGETCETCEGTRLAAIPRAVRLGGKRFHELVGATASELRNELATLDLPPRERTIAEAPLGQLDAKLSTLEQLGLDYLALDRRANTLSGGEMQRLRLAAQIGAGLTGVLYVLDEPTIGLHGRDTHRLVNAMRRLVDRGASVMVVEHDADVIRAADHLIDLGPGGGKAGGAIVSHGAAHDVLADDASPTARSLRVMPGQHARKREVPPEQPSIVVKGARAHNLKNVTARFPLQRLVCVAGVSGSGKSTLVEGILYPALLEKLKLTGEPPLEHAGLTGATLLETVKMVDQSPIGRTPRSVPATYIGIWDEIRKMLATTPEARARGWNVGRFSFNTTTEKGGGRCEACEGGGVKNVEMSFLPDVVIPCEGCNGLRFSRETREVTLHGYDAGEILQLTVDEARQVFSQVSSLARPLNLLADLGLGYLTLGQGSHTLSGGEAQRIKLATELSGRGGGAMYVLDEPTTGLHLSDVERLVAVLQRLVDRGDSLVVVEHHPSVLASADWIIEMGPDGGRRGGLVVAEGPPDVVATLDTATGAVLRAATGKGSAPPAPARAKKTARASA